MNKLRSLAICALVTPVITFGATSVLAQQSTDREMENKHQNTQSDRDSRKSGAVSTDEPKSTQRSGQSDSMTADRGKMGDKSHKQSRGYMASAPAKGMHASNLMGAEVKTTGDDDVGSVSDLIIDENGRVVAVVIGVGGVLGMGEKDIAIGWDDVTRSGTAEEPELRIEASQDDLRSAPEFEVKE